MVESTAAICMGATSAQKARWFREKRFLKGNVALFREIATMTENVRASLSVARITA